MFAVAPWRRVVASAVRRTPAAPRQGNRSPAFSFFSSSRSFSTTQSFSSFSFSSSSRLLWLVASGIFATSIVAVASATPGGDTTILSEQEQQQKAGGLDPKNFIPLKLKSVDEYNHNARIYHFALPDPNGYLNLPVSSAIMTRYLDAEDNNKPVIRPYTPIDVGHKGELILLVKTYEKGKMSKHFGDMKVGDTLEVKGPVPKLKYEPNTKKKLGFIVGGTGITPALQVIDEVLSSPSDKTDLHLLFANVSEDDILLKETIDQWQSIHPNFHVSYVVDSNTKNKDFKGEIGRIDKKMIERLLPIKPEEGKNVLIYVCGPPKFYDSISGNKNMKDYSQGPLSGALKEICFTEEQVYKF